MVKKIEFVQNQANLYLKTDSPAPAKNFVPEWFKKQPAFNHKKPVFNHLGAVINKGIKMCMPFTDSLITGYIQTTWTDIWIEKREDGVVMFSYASEPKIMDSREHSFIETNGSYYDIEFVWKMHWSFSLPKGYSLLLTHPLNRLDLPFTTLSGIVDDQGITFAALEGGNLPFYLKKDFEGMIPKGTPMYQVIPFKREDWQSNVRDFNEKEYVKNSSKTNSKFWGYYKDNFWKRKKYD